MNFGPMIKKIVAAKAVLLFTHVNMDGDAMGSTIALCHVMRKLGKHCMIAAEDPVPHYLRFLEPSGFFIDHERFDSGDLSSSLGFVVDLGDISRLEKRKPLFLRCGDSCLLDHHIYKAEDAFAAVEIRDPKASSACVLVQELIEAMEADLGIALMDRFTAEALYVGELTDTGAFKYSNTDARTHLCVARLFAQNIDHSAVCAAIYDNYPMQQLKLESIITERMVLSCGGKAALSWCTAADMESAGAQLSMAETGVDRIRSCEGVEIAALIKEKAPGVYKVSLRSKSYANVNRIAAAFGGGGHIKASGFNSAEDLQTLKKQLTAAMEKELAAWTE